MEIVPPFWGKARHEKQAGVPVCTFSIELSMSHCEFSSLLETHQILEGNGVPFVTNVPVSIVTCSWKSHIERGKSTDCSYGILQQHSARPLTRIPLILALKKVFKLCLKIQILKQNELIILSILHTQKVTLQLCVAKIVTSKVWRQMTSRRQSYNTCITNKRQVTFPEKWLSEIKNGRVLGA